MLKVGIHAFPPLTRKLGPDKWTGFEVELWEKIADNLDLEFEYVEVENFKDLLNRTAAGEFDLSMAGISRLSERRKTLDMSFLTLDSGLTILTRKTSKLPISLLMKNLFNSGLSSIILILFIVAFIIANVFWFLEKGASVAPTYISGLFESFWWAIVTFSTVGYGDIFPLTLAGKFFGIFAIMIGLAVFGLYIANLSSALSLERSRGKVNGLSDLQLIEVGTKAGTSTVSYLHEHSINPKEYQNLKDAYHALLTKKIDAVVFDAPVLKHDVRTMENQTTLVGGMFARQTYTFVSPKDGAGLIDKINGEIIRLHDNEQYDALYDKYFE